VILTASANRLIEASSLRVPANPDAAYGQYLKHGSPFDSGTRTLYNRSIAKLPQP